MNNLWGVGEVKRMRENEGGGEVLKKEEKVTAKERVGAL